jgi:hypothetical protein
MSAFGEEDQIVVCIILIPTGQARKICLGLAIIGMLESTPR